jgi:hypothetical protein
MCFGLALKEAQINARGAQVKGALGAARSAQSQIGFGRDFGIS